MGDFDDKLESILNNPQAMSQIMSLAQSLGGNEEKQPKPQESDPPDKAPFPLDSKLLGLISSLFAQYNNNDDQRIALLNSLRPFVNERRYAKLDKAIQIAKLSRMARMALELLQTKEEVDV